MTLTRKIEELTDCEISITEDAFMEELEWKKENDETYTFTDYLQSIIKQVYAIGHDDGVFNLQVKIDKLSEDMQKEGSTLG
jgi:hypothetical protein